MQSKIGIKDYFVPQALSEFYNLWVCDVCDNELQTKQNHAKRQLPHNWEVLIST